MKRRDANEREEKYWDSFTKDDTLLARDSSKVNPPEVAYDNIIQYNPSTQSTTRAPVYTYLFFIVFVRCACHRS
jgi:hypothetical protein